MPKTVLRIMVVLLFLTSSAFAALDAAQQKSLANVGAYLKNVEDNIKLAQDAAGPGDATPSATKARLSKTRLAQAEANLPPAVELLGKLPADDETVKAAKARADAAGDAIKKLNDRLAGKPTAGAAAAAGKPLDYRQREQLKGTQLNLKEVEGNAAALAEMADKIKSVTDINTLDYRDITRGMNTIANAQRKAGFVEDTLAQLPADGAGVAETRARLDTAKQSVAASAEVINPINAKLQKTIDGSSYPNLEADVKRLQQLVLMYGDTNDLTHRHQQAAIALQQKDAALAEANRIATEYAAVIKQQTELGKRIEGTGNYFTEKYKAYLVAADAAKSTLPTELRADLAKIGGMGDEATKNQTPAWFTNGILDELARVDEKMVLLKVIDPAGATAIQGETTSLKAKLKQQEKALEAKIIEQNSPPPDRYSGGDKAQLTALAVDTWKKQQPDAKVLGVFIPSSNWARSTRWEYRSGTWYFYDSSRLQAQVVVAQDDRLAVVRAINLVKNHEKNDEVTAGPLNALGDPVIPQHYLLRSKLK